MITMPARAHFISMDGLPMTLYNLQVQRRDRHVRQHATAPDPFTRDDRAKRAPAIISGCRRVAGGAS